MSNAPPRFTPKNPDFEAEMRATLKRQGLMATLGAEIARISPGEVEIVMPFGAHLAQQHGFAHAGALTTIVDTACGLAAFTLMPKGAGVLTVEFKMNLMAPGAGERFIAVGRVVRPGKSIYVTLGDVFAETAGERKHVAMMTATMMAIDEAAMRKG